MTKEQTAVEWIADRFRQYQIEGYKCNWDEVIQTVLLAKEIEDKELAKESEKAKKLMEAVQSFVQASDDFNAGYINRNGEITRCGIAALSLALTAAEKRLRISLTEYEKL